MSLLIKVAHILLSRSILKPNLPNILVYLDEGVSVLSAYGTLSTLNQVLLPDAYNVKIVSHDFVNTADWETNTDLFIMPGGRSLPHYTALSEGGNEKLVKFVHKGGKYLGLCAGAYYGCAQTEFAQGYPLEINLVGPLNFFKGSAKGPVIVPNKFRYHRRSGARPVSVALQDDRHGITKITGDIYFNGGCYFFCDIFDSAYVLANYIHVADRPSAIVECDVGCGRAILSGVHPEISYRMATFPFNIMHTNLYYQLKSSEVFRLYMMSYLLQRLGVLTKTFSEMTPVRRTSWESPLNNSIFESS